MTHDRLLDIPRAERKGHLAQVPVVQAQYGDLSIIESGRQHEPIERVGLDRTGHQIDECTLDFGMLIVRDGVRRHVYADVVEMDGGWVSDEHRGVFVER